MSRKENREEKLIGSEFNFQKIRSIELNWIECFKSSHTEESSSNNNSILDLEVYVLCLNNGILPDVKSILFYNNSSTDEKSLSGDFGFSYFFHPGFDRLFTLNPNQLDIKYDEIIFIMGNSKSSKTKNRNLINQLFVKKVADEICYIDCTLKTDAANDFISIRNIKYEYNKYGALVLFRFKKINEYWKLDLSHDIYQNGLHEIVKKHIKQDSNKPL